MNLKEKEVLEECAAVLEALAQKLRFVLGERDSCQVCHGESGGVPGNENVVDGVVTCDYCSSKQGNQRNIP